MYISGQCRDKPKDRPTDRQSEKQACCVNKAKLIWARLLQITLWMPLVKVSWFLVIELTYFDLILHVYIRVVLILWYRTVLFRMSSLCRLFGWLIGWLVGWLVGWFVCLSSIFRSYGDVFVGRRDGMTMKLVTGSLFTGIHLRQTHVLELIQV